MGIIIILLLIVLAYFLVRQYKQNTSASPEQKAKEEGAQPQKTYSPTYLLRLAEVKRQAEARGDTATVHAVLNMTYDGPLPIVKPDGSFTDLQSTILTYNIAGINFRTSIRDYVGDFIGYLKPEPKNKYDHNAIAIRHSDGKHLGYIPADETDDIRDLNIPFPIPIWGGIEEDYDEDDDRIFCRGTIFIEIHPKVSPSNL